MKSAFEQSGNKLIYYWRESVGTALFLTLFAGIWNAVVLGALYATITGEGLTIDDVPYTSITEAYAQNPIIIIFIIFPVIGFVMAYLALSFWLNRTTFSYDGFYLEKKTSPLPMKGDLKVSRSSIVKVFVKEAAAPKTKKVTYAFNVFANTIEGTEIPILNMGLKNEDAQALARWINERMAL